MPRTLKFPSSFRESLSRRAHWWIFGAAVAVRAIVAARTSVIFEDGPYFLDVARAFSEGRFADALAHPYHPLYSALVAAVQPIFGDFELAAMAVSCVGGAIAVAACFLLLREAFGERPAWIGAILLAVSPYPVRFTADVASEGVYLACFTASLTLFWLGVQRDRRVSLFAAGLLSGLAYLARPEGAGLIGIGLVWFVYTLVRGERTPGEAGRDAAALLAGGLVFVLPYVAVVSQRAGSVALSGKKSLARTLGLSEGPIAEPWLLAIALVALVLSIAGVAWLRTAPGRPVARTAIRALPTVVLLAFVVLTAIDRVAAAEFAAVVGSTLRPEILLFVLAGIWGVSREGFKDRDTFFFLVFTAYAVLLVGLLESYGYLSRRHFVPLMPLLVGYAGVGVTVLADAIAAQRLLRLAMSPPRVAFALCTGLILIAAPKTLHDHRREALAERLAAEWIAEQELRSGWVASDKRRIAYYAGRKWQPIRVGREVRPLEELAGDRVRYIVTHDPASIEAASSDTLPRYTTREIHRIHAGGRTAVVYALERDAEAHVSAGPAIRESYDSRSP